MTSGDYPLQPIVKQWLHVIRMGDETKQKRFGADASEVSKFYTGPYEFLWRQMRTDRHMNRGADDIDAPGPPIQVQVNKVAEFVQIFGPALYSKNPVRTVNPRDLPTLDPQLYAMMGGPNAQMIFQQSQGQDQGARAIDSARARLIETYLNYTPKALGLRNHSRAAIDEALIKGMGCLWTETYTPPGGGFKMVGSFQDSVDNLVMDPDAISVQDAKWIARRCVHPTWQVEQEFGLKPGSLKQRGSYESTAMNSAIETLEREAGYFSRRQGHSNDLIVYWRVFSKMGIGGRLINIDPALRALLEVFGQYCHIVVADGVEYPLNIPPEVIDDPNGAPVAQQRLQWPTPFWADGGWPFQGIGFHAVPNSPWPLNHMAPAMGELKFMNWCMGHLATKVRSTSRDFIAVLQSAGDELKQKILHGSDLELLQLQESHGKTISEIVQFLQHPRMNGDIIEVLNMVMEQFDKRTGLTELMYGATGTQIRSGTEAKIRNDTMNVRPDDMADSVEAAMSQIARMEALAARWHLEPNDVRPMLGPIGASWWEQLVYAADPREIIYNLEFEVEAGTARKQNKQAQVDNATALMTNMFPPLMQYGASTGNYNPVNSVIDFWAEANDIRNKEDFHLVAPMPVAPAPAPNGPPPGQGGPPNQGPPAGAPK